MEYGIAIVTAILMVASALGLYIGARASTEPQPRLTDPPTEHEGG